MSSKRSRRGVSRFEQVVFLNPQTCGIYKNGGIRYKTDANTGKRTKEIDNQLAEVVNAYLAGKSSDMISTRPRTEVFQRGVLVPRYFDERWNSDLAALAREQGVKTVSMGTLIDDGIITVDSGHGSPSNDQRAGGIPYVKVSDIRSLRVNVNPTNLVTRRIAEMFWGAKTSGLQPWDLVTPNRASSNIGEFAAILPGEEQVVLTKEVFVVRVIGGREAGWSAFYLLWAFCLKAVRRQWQRVTLMQTNREDVGERYREVMLPVPKTAKWAREVSAPFERHFTALAEAKRKFRESVASSGFEYIANVVTNEPTIEDEEASGDLPLDH
jgi:type I restriction enzyme M protein